ncbi:MAG: phosphodiester glycosidase family protein [Parachlamydiaceae bacterium]|nr:phosphodiester glycosidase family protein [Parachlamydiaceae bacterium]
MKFLVLLLSAIFYLWTASVPLVLYGYSYECFSRGNFTSIHVLTVDPKEHVIVPVKANGKKIKRETVRNLAIRHGAIAAINGGFWKANGAPAGVLKIDSFWYGTPTKPRGAIGWSHDGQKVIIDQVLTNHSLLDCPEGEEIAVISASTSSDEWKMLEHIVGGVPVLVRNEALVQDYSTEETLETFLTKTHSRTAVGIKKSGEWVFVVVDGRLFGLLGGMSIRALSKLMLELGCVDALNLDGGSSSTLFVEGSVMNESYGKIWENGKFVQAVSDAILILDR